MPKSSSGLLSPTPSQRAGRLPVLILFLPYMLHPAQHVWRFYAAWQNSWTTRRTLWLALLWLLVFLLAVGLLVGLLVPWGNLGKTSFSVGPQLVAVSATQVSLVLQLNRDAMLYYAVLPQAALIDTPAATRRRHLASGASLTALAAAAAATAPAELPCARPPCAPPPLRARRPGRRSLATDSSRIHLPSIEADDVQAIAEWAEEDARLFPYAVACGMAQVPRRRANYTLTIDGHARTVPTGAAAVAAAGNASAQGALLGGLIAPLLDECVASFGLQVPNSTLVQSSGPFLARRCQRCPSLQPGTAYVVLLVGDGGRSTGIVQVKFTTAAAAA
ncbi:hypothetical protein TSOC_006089 [Tetrabaena socialis]|uniref:Uncharacterized protein n=1 Tax=Tetrabaena socialis TaxID=47790 RepID=A0A2J8A4L9_9CHLO|nr:hypothetical protein TSOC_006089 [Tetrabaena socialis]|eukprot:PNH07464.1 hypothetical protein TSOC_006089 [Tetrabaena socialis]